MPELFNVYARRRGERRIRLVREGIPFEQVAAAIRESRLDGDSETFVVDASTRVPGLENVS